MEERDHLIGLHGLAMLRAGTDARTDAVTEHRRAIAALLRDRSPQPSRALREVTAQEGYRYWASSYDDRRNPLIAAEEPAVRSLIKGLPRGDCVDVGCGTGRHTEWLVAQGHRVTATDSSPEMLAVAERRAGPAVTVLADIAALPLPDGCADLVVCALVLSHLTDLTPIAELARLLRPGGRLVISNPHPFSTSVLGSRAWTRSPDGERVSIPEQAHPLSEYVTAFRNSALVPTALLEPTHPDDEPLMAHEPAAVIWAAERPRE